MNLKIKKNDFVVYIFFFLISLSKGLGLNNANSTYLILYCLGIFLACFKLLEIGFNKNEIRALSIIIIIGILDFIIGKETTVLFTGITLLFLKNCQIKSIIKSMFYGRIVGLILMIGLACFGIIEMNIINFYRGGEFINRYAFGYSHPNFAHSCFNIVVIMWIYLYFNKINFGKIMIVEVLNFILYKYTLSRTGFLIITVFLIVGYITKKSDKIKKILPNILNKVFIVSLLLGFILAFGYNKIEIVNKLDQVLTGRISYIAKLINNYNPPIIKYQNYENILFDNGYVDLLYNGGILATLWLFYMQIKTNKYIKENALYKEALISMIFIVYSITESYYMSSIMNISILFIAYQLFNKGEETKKADEIKE